MQRWECPTHITAWAPVLQADETPLCGRRGCGQPLALVQYVPREAASDLAEAIDLLRKAVPIYAPDLTDLLKDWHVRWFALVGKYTDDEDEEA